MGNAESEGEIIVPSPKGKQPAHFARQTDKSKVRKMMLRDQVAKLVVEEKMTQPQVAEVSEGKGVSQN